MKQIQAQESGMKKALSARRRPVSISQSELVKAGDLEAGRGLPLLVEPAVENVDLSDWMNNNRQFAEAELFRRGAILFRGFDVKSARDFQQFVSAASGDLLPYCERSSPRQEVGENVYTSTDYPPDQSIFPHNEQSYNLCFPLKLFFFCQAPAEQGGATPIGDTRRIFKRIDPKIRERFMEKKYMYVRNFGDGLGLSWQTAFQTGDKAAVEEYCRGNDIDFKWTRDGGLRTSQVREVVRRHPRTGEPVWFNHATFFHVSTLAPAIRDTLLAQFEEEDLPNNTFYGDGSPIEPSVLDELRASYQEEMITFQWRKGDVVMLDNMLTAHARAPYAGSRKILFAMTTLFDTKEN